MSQQAHSYSDMHLDPSRSKHLTHNLSSILARISAAKSSNPSSVRLVAVSKLKPANDILALYQSSHSQLHFGENYLQELVQKSQLLPQDIRWHFIGALQTNKCKPLAEQIPNLWCVESVDTAKKADQLEKGRHALSENQRHYETTPLRVFVQINTSGEEEKSGIAPEDAAELCKHIKEHCLHLHLQGVMTIGAIARSKHTSEGNENEDFITLRNVRDRVSDALEIPKEDMELSMGMSEDFESAVRCGSNEVRVGSTIFGERPSKQDAKIRENAEEGKS